MFTLFQVLGEGDFEEHQNRTIEETSVMLGVTIPTASKLLIEYRWDLTKLRSEWDKDRLKVCVAIGLTLADVLLSDRLRGTFKYFVHTC